MVWTIMNSTQEEEQIFDDIIEICKMKGVDDLSWSLHNFVVCCRNNRPFKSHCPIFNEGREPWIPKNRQRI